MEGLKEEEKFIVEDFNNILTNGEKLGGRERQEGSFQNFKV